MSSNPPSESAAATREPRADGGAQISSFDQVQEQREAKRLLEAALEEGPAHAYLFYGPPGVGKEQLARLFGRVVLGTTREVHPDLYVLAPLGDMIRIDAIRELRRDLHMRPFEADRRVYLVLGAHLLNEDAADALLKDLEEPPAYAVIILVADALGPIPETIRSRCQLVPFTRLSERALHAALNARAPDLDEQQRTTMARVAAGRLDRLTRLLDANAATRRDVLIDRARAVYRDDGFDPAEAAAALLRGVRQRALEAKRLEEVKIEGLELRARDAEQRVRRAEHGAEREELLAQLEELASWYRDLVVVAVGAERAAVHVDRIDDLRLDASRERLAGAQRAVETVLETWRELAEFNLTAQLALEALFIRLTSELRP